MLSVETLDAKQALIAAGFKESQADAMVRAFALGQGNGLTKEDLERESLVIQAQMQREIDRLDHKIDAVELNLSGRQDLLASQLRGEIQASEHRMTRKLYVSLAGQAGFIVVLLKLLEQL